MLKRPILWLVVLTMIFLEGSCITMRRQDVKSGVIGFAALYGTARDVRAGSSVNYDASRIHSEDKAYSLDATSVPQDRVDLLHAPVEVLLFLPLTLFPYATAYLVWSACSIVFLWLVPLVLWRFIPRLHPEAEVLAGMYGIMLPVLLCLWEGQDSFLLLLLMSLSFAALANGHELRSGVLLALGLFKFHLVLPLVAALFVARRWRAVAGFLAGFAGLVLATFAVVGPRATLHYIPFILYYGNRISVNASERTAMMPNLRGLIAFSTSSFLGPRYQSLLVVGASAILLLLMLGWIYKFRNLSIPVQFSFVLLITSFISYHYYGQNAVILALPLLLLGNECLATDIDPQLRRAFQMVAVLTAGTLALGTLGMIFLKVAELVMPLLAIESILLAAIVFAVPFRQKKTASHASKESVLLAVPSH